MAVLAAPAAAQDPDSVPPPPDTLGPLRPQPPDTTPRPIALDTLVRDTAGDTVPPPPRLPDLPAPGPAAWEVGVWEWDRRDLLRLPDLSLLELLERVPGVVPVRVSIAAQPEAPAVLGASVGAVRYVVDGYELDPLTTPTFDPSRLPLLALARVRVERRVTGAIVRMETLSPSDHRPESIIEAGTGDLGINLFRGMFLAPDVLGGPLALGFERLATGAGGGANHTGGWLKWTFVRDSAGVQLEYRQSEMDRRTVDAGFLGERRDWALRARAPLVGFTAEAYAGATTVEDRHGALVLREGTPQAGVRVHRSFGAPLELRATARFRDHPRLPRTELGFEAWTQPARWLGVGGDVTRGWWDDGVGTGQAAVRGRLGPVLGLSAFAEASLALPGAPAPLRLFAPPDSPVHAPERQGRRAGLSLDIGGLHLGGALLTTTVDSAAVFGLFFDPEAPRFAAGEASGFEATARIPTGFSPLWLEGWLVSLDAPETWPYLPAEHGRAALVYHHIPLPSGNLELYARGEYVYRGPMAVPCAPPLDCETLSTATLIIPGALVSIPDYQAVNLELTIRVVTVRAFLRWENILNRRFQSDLPELFLPGQRVLYGVKWELWN